MGDTRLSWNTLLCETTLRTRSKIESAGRRGPIFDGRNPFEDDYTRVIFSSPFRRLQDKSQVFPLERGDFVRTRLTHSLEVSAIARSLGAVVERFLRDERGDIDVVDTGKVPAILATAGAIHDLGNPPFGHAGELAIRRFFEELFSSDGRRREELDEAQRGDFVFFDGNPQTFRIATHLQYLTPNRTEVNYGMNLTSATLASLLKYPRSSLTGNRRDLGASYHKHGYFQAEKEKFAAIAELTGITRRRHPLAFLLEAADDIAYSADDIEDGYKKNAVSLGDLKDVIREHCDDSEARWLCGTLDEYVKEVDVVCHERDKREVAIGRFRALVQGFMIRAVVETFRERYDDIMSGDFDAELLACSRAAAIRTALKKLARSYVFNHQMVIDKELTGEKVIRGLLADFVAAVTSDKRKDPTTREGKLYSLISSNYRFICENYHTGRPRGLKEPPVYDRLLLVTDYVCGMTDSYALDLYQRLCGVKLSR